MKKRPQATRANRAQVFLHISRQRALGANMLRGSDRPRVIELVVTAVLVITILFAHARGWL
jgi:hypothetical protein